VYLVELGWFVRGELVFVRKSSDWIDGEGVVGCRRGPCTVGGGLVWSCKSHGRFLCEKCWCFHDYKLNKFGQ
jgi:hypothetical protein